MRSFRPDYYEQFKCSASDCKHNCCIGWEIDIDEDTMENYLEAEGEMGTRLKESISFEGDCPHFILGEKERCPFLNEENLCDIIINMGEDNLCDICKAHPRFVNEIEDREEIGLGLCCEAAAKLIIGNKEKVKLIGEENVEEAIIFNIRSLVIETLQNREKPIDERVKDVLKMMNISIPEIDWVLEFIKLERLDRSWSEMLYSLKGASNDLIMDWSVPFEQILVYFVYRYMAEGMYDGRYNERIAFAILSYYMIKELFKRGEETMENLCDIARRYSCEVEYSEENVERILSLLGG